MSENRPPKPPRRRCDYPGCDLSPYPANKDWATSCRAHQGVKRPLRAKPTVTVLRVSGDAKALALGIGPLALILTGDDAQHMLDLIGAEAYRMWNGPMPPEPQP